MCAFACFPGACDLRLYYVARVRVRFVCGYLLFAGVCLCLFVCVVCVYVCEVVCLGACFEFVGMRDCFCVYILCVVFSSACVCVCVLGRGMCVLCVGVFLLV